MTQHPPADVTKLAVAFSNTGGTLESDVACRDGPSWYAHPGGQGTGFVHENEMRNGWDVGEQ
ncbi:hypothetical protein ColTof4_00703 [Colletotrichum tofieldiae]|nr:hypothetical protein ColTof3_07916 [Colletotrichum tofieldiae]GKT68280.1 hypothetical protein ColTof4_00703 [Colletotrichum tofieldiae]GKT90713.1 hypothetical protein Ct61P_08563 [Colletotrichum tofieldiae]